MKSVNEYMLQHLLTLSVVGVYALGNRFGSLIDMLFVQPLKLAYYPVVMQMEEQPLTLRNFVSKTATIYYAVALWACLGVSLLTKETIEIIGRNSEFNAAWTVVPFIAYAHIWHGMGHFFSMGIFMQKKTYLISKINFVTAVLTIFLSYVLISYIGIIGAGITYLLAYLILTLPKAYYSYKLYSLSFDLGKIAIMTFSGIVLYLLSLPIQKLSIYPSITLKLCLIILFPLSEPIATKYPFSKGERFRSKSSSG